MNLQRRYIDSPRYVKQTAGCLLRLIPSEYLYGKKFRRTLKSLKAAEFLSKEELASIQFLKLKELLGYAYREIPYYKNLFDLHNVKVTQISSPEDIRRIPFLDKNEIKKNFAVLQSSKFKKRHRSYATTGGTSGEPLAFYIDKDRSSIEWAFLNHIWRRIGYRLNDRRVVLRGDVIKNKRSRLYAYDPLLKQLSLSTFHMSEKNLASYVRLINQFKPNFIHGYPSAIITLAQFMRRKKLHFEFKLKGIIGISENILEAQRSYITSTFQTRFFSFYGHSEKLVLAGECEKNNFYHIEPLYGFAEIIDFNGKPVMHAGQKGELVGTGFINHAMPFIRYRTGDLVELSGEKCECGREYILLKKIEGRWLQEMLVTKERFLVSITALNMHSSIFDNVAKFQFEQDEPGKAVLNIIKSNSFSENDGKLILTELERKLDNQIDLELAFVDEINPNISGKSLFLKQNIDIRKFWPQFD